MEPTPHGTSSHPTRKPRLRAIEARLHVADLARSLSFYAELLGLEVDGLWPENDPSFAILRNGSVQLQLYRVSKAEHETGPGHGPVTLWIDAEDVASLHRTLRERVPIEWGPEVYFYGRREFAIRDPDGCLIIFSEATDDPPTCPDE